MGLYKYQRKLYQQPKKNLGEIWKERLVRWRQEPVSVKIDRPTRLDRARSLGYKAKQGIIMVRQRVIRGGRMRPKASMGRRRPKTSRRTLILDKSYQQVAEERAQRNYKNLNVLNSYEIMKDGRYYWFEVILFDPSHPSIKKDKQLGRLCTSKHTGRVFRGLTASGRRSRGLLKKGKGAEKIRKHH
ncbi:MAG: 50S ribosomal protein L15e [DPANN group archaeon]|nr:50S ribosomal protein L15e [DPANN group archaeon]